MKKVNYHTHTKRCKHAEGMDEEYILNAISNNVHTLGFSDHGPYKDNRFGLRMDYSELDEYLTTLTVLKDKYKEKINIKIGLEIEYNKNELVYYEYLLKKFDYLILGQHIFLSNDNYINSYELKDTSYYIEYAKTISDALDKNIFSFVAHPDLVFLNNNPWDNNCEEACNIIINSAKKNNSILEFNANGIRSGLLNYPEGKRYRYPYKKFWDKVAKNNIKTIVSSDCHTPTQTYDIYMDKGIELAKEWNLNLVDYI